VRPTEFAESDVWCVQYKVAGEQKPNAQAPFSLTVSTGPRDKVRAL